MIKHSQKWVVNKTATEQNFLRHPHLDAVRSNLPKNISSPKKDIY